MRQDSADEAADTKSISTFWIPINDGMQQSVHRRSKTWEPAPRAELTRGKSFTKTRTYSGTTTASKKSEILKSHSFSSGSTRTIQRASATWDLAEKRLSNESIKSASSVSSVTSGARLYTQVNIKSLHRNWSNSHIIKCPLNISQLVRFRSASVKT